MRDYEPIDLTDACNRTADEIDGGADLALGPGTMRGLPFLLGSAGGDRVVVADGASPSVTIPIGGSAHRVILAHRLLEVAEGSPTGTRVGRVRVPVRGRRRGARRHTGAVRDRDAAL